MRSRSPGRRNEIVSVGLPGRAIPKHTVPTAMPSCSVGPATPVTAMPTSASRTRCAPSAISRAASSLTTTSAVTPSTERFTSVAYAPIVPRNTSLAPGTLTMRAPMNPPVTDSATPSDQPRARKRSSTANSIVSSSTPNTRSPRIARSSFSSLSTIAHASASVAPLAVMRTTSPSMPRARKAIVASPGLVERVEPVRHHLRERRLRRAPRLERARHDRRGGARTGKEVGDDVGGDHLLHLVGHARAPRRRPCRRPDSADPARCRSGCGSPRRPRERRPGAGCSRACRAGAPGTSSRCARRDPCAARAARPSTPAIASRVRSSCVGPRPPHTSTASERDSRSRNASTMRDWLSPIGAMLVRVDARQRELLTDPGTVRVDDLPEKQFRTDGENLTAHRGAYDADACQVSWRCQST